MTLICGVPRNYGSGKEGADRPRRGKNESQPPFIRTPPAAACRSLFLSLLIKAKRFLLLPLKPGAPTSLGQRGGPAAAPSRDGPPRPHAAGHDPAGMAFKRREHLVGMGIDVERRVQLRHFPPAEEGQPWFMLDVGMPELLMWEMPELRRRRRRTDRSCTCVGATQRLFLREEEERSSGREIW